MKEELFVYGTLRDADIQKSVIGRVTAGQADILAGYEKSTVEVDGETFPALVPGPEGVVEGIVLEVTPEEMAKIDEYETEAYKREIVALKSRRRAWVYLKVG